MRASSRRDAHARLPGSPPARPGVGPKPAPQIHWAFPPGRPPIGPQRPPDRPRITRSRPLSGPWSTIAQPLMDPRSDPDRPRNADARSTCVGSHPRSIRGRSQVRLAADPGRSRGRSGVDVKPVDPDPCRSILSFGESTWQLAQTTPADRRGNRNVTVPENIGSRRANIGPRPSLQRTHIRANFYGIGGRNAHWRPPLLPPLKNSVTPCSACATVRAPALLPRLNMLRWCVCVCV